MGKVKKTVNIDSELLDWINHMIETKEFGSLSHAINKALIKLKREYETRSAHKR